MKTVFCCKEIEIFLNDPRDPIEYNPVFREHFIRLDNRSNIITLAYCPWCGNKLPTSLREKYFNALKKEHGIDTNLGEYKERSDIPDDFRSDKWWKVREVSPSSFDQFVLNKRSEETFSENNLWKRYQWQRLKKTKLSIGKCYTNYEDQRERTI